jgi:hypothetical protein
MQLVITVFLALLLWGSASFAAANAGIPRWIPAICLLIVGVIIHLVYARLVNSRFDTVGMTDWVRIYLRDDLGGVPLWITITGMLARALMLAGVLPLFEAGSCIFRSTVGT